MQREEQRAEQRGGRVHDKPAQQRENDQAGQDVEEQTRRVKEGGGDRPAFAVRVGDGGERRPDRVCQRRVQVHVRVPPVVDQAVERRRVELGIAGNRVIVVPTDETVTQDGGEGDEAGEGD